MKKKKQLGILIGAVVLIIAAAAVGKSLFSSATGGEASLPQVEVAAAKTGEVEERLDTSGTVVSDRVKVFFSPVNATVEKVNFQVGDVVKEGDKLVTFNLKDLEEQNEKAKLTKQASDYGNQDTINKANAAAGRQAQAAADAKTLKEQVASKEQEVADLKAAIADAGKTAREDAEKEAEKTQKQAKETYKKTSKEYQKQVKAAAKAETQCQQLVNTAQSAYNTAKTEYDVAFASWNAETDAAAKEAKEKALMEKDAAVNAAQTALNQAQVSLEQATEVKKALEANQPTLSAETKGNLQSAEETVVDTSDLQTKLETASSELAQLQSDLAAKEAASEGESAALSGEALGQMEANSDLQEMESKSIQELIKEGKKGIVAEFNGVISESQVVEGSAAVQGGQLFTLQSTDEVSVDVTVSKYDYEKVQEGQKAVITLAGREYEGTVSRVERIATPNEKGTPVIGVNVTIDKPDENIFIGVEAKVEIYGQRAEDAILVPVEAVNTGNNGSFCYVLREETIERQPIETGISSDDEIQITSGLKEGDLVILDLGSLEEGDQAQPAQEQTGEETQGQ